MNIHKISIRSESPFTHSANMIMPTYPYKPYFLSINIMKSTRINNKLITR